MVLARNDTIRVEILTYKRSKDLCEHKIELLSEIDENNRGIYYNES